jgi:DNA-binding response OmpR family regulator
VIHVPPPGPGDAEARSVLVADGDPVSRSFVARVLAHRGFAVRAVDSSEGALRVAEDPSVPLDLLVANARQGSAAPVLAQRVRRPRPGLPVLFIAADVEVPAIAPRMGCVGVAYLVEPFDAATLLRAVRGILSANA